jgi:Histidine kinase-, DNA gyrase B-, and HSP90-like ATPase
MEWNANPREQAPKTCCTFLQLRSVGQDDQSIQLGQSTQFEGATMGAVNLLGEAQISGAGIKKHFKSTDPIQAVFELVWNGFDAGAKEVLVDFRKNELGGVESVAVQDDGCGIDFEHPEENFGLFNDSAKKLDVGQHGAHGRGRLAFHRLARRAVWHTRRGDGAAMITVDAQDIRHFAVAAQEESELSSPGTLVVLEGVHKDLPEGETLNRLFGNAFGWYLALHPGKVLRVEGCSVSVPEHEVTCADLSINGFTFHLDVRRWLTKPSDEKSYVYLADSQGRVVHIQLSSLNNKKNFFTSVFVASSWADSFFPDADLINQATHTLDSKTWLEVEKEVSRATRTIYEDFLRKDADNKVAQYEEGGYFPSYAGLSQIDANWRLNNVKELIKNIYIADPALFSLGKRQTKVLIRLLDRLAVSNENDALWEILNGVLDLDQDSASRLAAQLQRTTLENIVNTIELLQRRLQTIHELRHLMDNHYAEVLETPDLQKIIENHTWLFGPQYELLGAEEATFTKLAKSMRDSLRGMGDVDPDDVEGNATIQGANRQPDLFLARKVPSFDNYGRMVYRCVVVEIKRPSVSLNVKHLRQLDDYAALIKKYPSFMSENMRFELLLVGRKISDADSEIADRLKSMAARGERGLVLDDGKTKRYVLNWYTLLDGHELANQALIESLRLKREDLTGTPKEALLGSLQGSSAPQQGSNLAH